MAVLDKPITTQEEFDEAIKERINRVEKKYEGYVSQETMQKKYAGFLSPEDVQEKYISKDELTKNYTSNKEVESKYAGYLSPEEVAKKDKLIKDYEIGSVKSKVAREVGLSFDAVEFLTGDNEESIKKSAESLKKLVGNRQSAPMANQDNDVSNNSQNAGIKKLFEQMKKEN